MIHLGFPSYSSPAHRAKHSPPYLGPLDIEGYTHTSNQACISLTMLNLMPSIVSLRPFLSNCAQISGYSARANSSKIALLSSLGNALYVTPNL